MPKGHTVEKIGGSSMSRFGEVMENVIIGDRGPGELYNRVFVVSAYGGVTDLLLENKKTGAPGTFAHFAQGGGEWRDALEKVRERMLEYNRSFEELGLDLVVADEFVNERIDAIRGCLNDVMQLRAFGHLQPANYLPASRELLSAVGEAHSAYNSVLILRANGVNARFVDLTGWKDTEFHSLDEMIEDAFSEVDFANDLPIVTGYVKCVEGIMTRFDRGYSEITFSRVAVMTEANEGIIHKEYHLSTGDPILIGTDKVRVIGNTNFDIADQLSDLDMEAIHSKASKEMELCDIPIRVKNAFEPEAPGTLIQNNYVSPEPRVEMICGRDDVIGVEVFDPEMVGEVGYDHRLLKCFLNAGFSYVTKNTNANTITHFLPADSASIKGMIEALQREFRGAKIRTEEVALVAVIGSNMKFPGFLAKAAGALARGGINVLAVDQCMRQVNMQFIVDREDFREAQIVLHRELVEEV